MIFHLFLLENTYALEQEPALVDSYEESLPINSSETAPKDIEFSKDEEKTSAKLEEEVLMKFLLEEVIPAFGGFQDLLFSNKPSFDIHWTPQGMQVKNCFFELQLRQLRTIKYNLADIALYGFQSNAEIGDPRFLFVQMSCGEIEDITDTARFIIKFFVTDEDLNSSYYGLKITTMGKEQLDIKLKSIEMDVDIAAVDYTLILDPYGHIEALPHGSPFLQAFVEDQAYVEVIEEGMEDTEDEQIKNMYDIPISMWNQIKGINEVSSDVDSIISLKKVKVEQIVNLKGSIEMFLPVYADGVKQDTRVVMPITGRIFYPVEGSVIPVIDISTK